MSEVQLTILTTLFRFKLTKRPIHKDSTNFVRCVGCDNVVQKLTYVELQVGHGEGHVSWNIYV